jgi:hypothetical protein
MGITKIMDLDYCPCGKKTFSNNFYCSNECENNESKSSNTTQKNPPDNLQFSITLSKNEYNTSNFKSYYIHDYVDENYDSNIMNGYTACSISPIIIQRNSVVNNEPNNGTFGKY